MEFGNLQVINLLNCTWQRDDYISKNRIRKAIAGTPLFYYLETDKGEEIIGKSPSFILQLDPTVAFSIPGSFLTEDLNPVPPIL